MEPDVSLIKFKEEIGNFHNISDDWREKGVFLIHEDYPIVEFMFTTPKLRPSAIAFCVQINYTNYDVEPLSLKFICPFTKKILNRDEVLLQFIQDDKQPDLLQSHQNNAPFLCIPGIKEYHDHPAHTGDSWLLHRKNSEGSLGFILYQLYDHSIPFIRGHKLSITIAGFMQQI